MNPADVVSEVLAVRGPQVSDTNGVFLRAGLADGEVKHGVGGTDHPESLRSRGEHRFVPQGASSPQRP